MMVGDWKDKRTHFIAWVSEEQLLALIERVAEGYATDENLGDSCERIETILWLATRGERGEEWGEGGVAAIELGMFNPESAAMLRKSENSTNEGAV